MLRKRNLVVVGLTTFNTEMLKISVSALANITSKFTLIIHNDNPQQIVTPRDIHKMGYNGQLHIINSRENVGLRMARLRILDAVTTVSPDAQWIIYVADDDVLLSADIPTVGENNFAIIQNNLVIRKRVADLIIASSSPDQVKPDGDNVMLERPHLGLAGTAVRIDLMRGLANLMHSVQIPLDEIDASLSFRPPVDLMMWEALNAYAKHINPEFAPIFMDSVNCIRNGIDETAEKYGKPALPARNAEKLLSRVMAQYEAVLTRAMTQC